MSIKKNHLSIAMLSLHSSPAGDLGTRDTGGMSVYIREFAREIGCLGHSVDIYTRLCRPEDQDVALISKNVRLIHLKAGRRSAARIPKEKLYGHIDDFFCSLEKFRERERLRYDLIHSHYWLSGCLGEKAQRRWDVPHLITFHTLGALKNLSGAGQNESRLRIAAEKKLAKNCCRILVSAEREKENLLRHYMVSADKISVVPCGVDLKLFRPLDKAKSRRRLGLKTDERIVLYVGRFDPLKGIGRLLEAAALVKRSGIRLIIIGGDGHMTPEFKKLDVMTRELGIESSVAFAGRVDQKMLPFYYCAADILVVPSLYESFGLVALESLACGRPVLATPVGAMEHIIQDCVNGLVAPNFSPRSLANVLRAFFSTCRLRAVPPKSVRASALRFGWNRVAAYMLAEYTLAVNTYRTKGNCRYGQGAGTHANKEDTSHPELNMPLGDLM